MDLLHGITHVEERNFFFRSTTTFLIPQFARPHTCFAPIIPPFTTNVDGPHTHRLANFPSNCKNEHLTLCEMLVFAVAHINTIHPQCLQPNILQSFLPRPLSTTTVPCAVAISVRFTQSRYFYQNPQKKNSLPGKEQHDLLQMLKTDPGGRRRTPQWSTSVDFVDWLKNSKTQIVPTTSRDDRVRQRAADAAKLLLRHTTNPSPAAPRQLLGRGRSEQSSAPGLTEGLLLFLAQTRIARPGRRGDRRLRGSICSGISVVTC